MTPTASEREFADHIVDLMESIGSVSARAMFGGFGIFLDGVMFGLIADNVLFFKVDQESEDELKALELEPFTYNKKGKEFKMSYYQAPAEVLEDSEAMARWALKAHRAAVRAASKRPKK